MEQTFKTAEETLSIVLEEFLLKVPEHHKPLLCQAMDYHASQYKSALSEREGLIRELVKTLELAESDIISLETDSYGESSGRQSLEEWLQDSDVLPQIKATLEKAKPFIS